MTAIPTRSPFPTLNPYSKETIEGTWPQALWNGFKSGGASSVIYLVRTAAPPPTKPTFTLDNIPTELQR